MSETNIVRRRERSGTETQAKSAVLMDAELGVITDVKKLVVGDGNKAGGYALTPDNIVSIWPDQTDAASPLSLAWWINRAGGADIKLRLPAGTYNIQDDLTVPGNVYLEADRGAILNITSGKTLTLNCEIGADAEIAFEGAGTVVENYVRRLFVNNNLISHRRHLWAEGAIRGTDGELLYDEGMRVAYIHSDFFEIEPNTLYTFRSHGPCEGFLVFFDSDKKYITVLAPSLATQQRKEGYSFTSPSNAAYFRVTSSRRSSGGELERSTLKDLGRVHLYKLEKGPVATSFSVAPQDSQEPVYVSPAGRPWNNPEAARQLVACAESYKERGWEYGNEQMNHDTLTAEGPDAQYLRNENGIKTIDCSTIILLAINGIPYFQSKYFNNAFPWRCTKYYGWAKCPNHLYIEGLARWCYDNGWEIDPGINYANLQAGDLIFWGNNPNKSNYEKWSKQFRGIDHVAMYTGRWVQDPDRDNELHPQTIEVGQEQPIVKNMFVDRQSNEAVITASSVEYIQMFARIPLESPFTEFDSAFNTDGVIYSSYYHPSVYATGNGQPLHINIYGRNCALWEIGGLNAENGTEYVTANAVRSAYYPSGYTYQNITAIEQAGFSMAAWHYYDGALRWLGTTPPAGGFAYARAVFRKTDGTAFTDGDFKSFVQKAAIHKYGRDTAEDGKYPQGWNSYAHLETIIPNGAYLDRRNGKYAYTEDGVTWTELPESDQTKLNALRIGDGENNIYIPNAQHVKLMRQAMD